MYTDTSESHVVSWFCRNRYTQVLATHFGWVQVFLMCTKSEAHEPLSLLAKCEGVPPQMIMDGSKEQTLSKFHKKLWEMGCEICQMELDSPQQNAAEGAIHEVKHGAGRKQAKKRSPFKLWDHWLELEAYIQLNMALNSYELQGQVLATILSRQTADISPFVQHGWYDWIKYYYNHVRHPEPEEVYSNWLCPSVSIGSVMTSKILKQNAQILHLSPFCGLDG